MKRLLLLVACLLLTTFASAGDYTTVTGSGKSFEEAKQQAFRKAIEFKVGAAVLSDVETSNYQRIKDEIYVYSAGYVEDFRVLKQENYGTSVVVLMEVLVAEGRIRNRILSEGKSSKEFAGERHSAQASTFLQERQQGDRMLGQLFANYPHKAYHIKEGAYNITLDYRRNTTLNIEYEMWWNYDFVMNLREILSVIEDKSNGFNKPSAGAIVIMAKDPKDWLLGKRTDHLFNDLNRVDQVHDYIQTKTPRIVVTFKDIQNRTVYAVCHTPKFIWGGGDSFYSTGNHNTVVIYGNVKEKGTIQTPAPLEIIDKINKIELSIVAENVCKK